MSRFTVSLLLLLVLAALLFATNPGQSEYEDFLEEKIQSGIKQEVENDFLGGVLSLFSGSIAKMITSVTEKQDYYLFSVYTTKIDDENSVTYLGILNHFFLLEKKGDLLGDEKPDK